jgi:hypothetical protein
MRLRNIRFSFSVLSMALLLLAAQADLAAQFPRLSSLPTHDNLRAAAPAEPYAPKFVPDESQGQRIGILTKRIDTHLLDVHVYQSGQPVALFPQLHELVTAVPADGRKGLEDIQGRSVALVPSAKAANQWEVFRGVAGGELCLADNIFVVRQVLVSTRKKPIRVQVDGTTHRLKPGEVLLVM